MKEIPVCEPFLGGKELENVKDCVKSGWISGKGKYITEFEKSFASYCSAKYGIAVMNGTASLHLAMLTAGVERGDEVIVPDFTMISSANSIVYVGGRPVWVDAEHDTWNMDVEKVRDKISDKTKAIMPVHIYGHPVDMDPLVELAEENDLVLVEDAAEAHGAEYKGRKVGSLGDIGCFSFYANKIVTTGEGGMVVTSNRKIAERARRFRDLYFGKDRRYMHEKVGFNFRMTNIQAAIGLAQMGNVEKVVEMKRNVGKKYNSLLGKIAGIRTPIEKDWAKNVYWMYTIMLDDEFGTDRDSLREKLKKKGIETRTVFSPMHKQPCFAEMGFGGKDSDYPVTMDLSKRGLYLPSSPKLTESEIRYICGAIEEIGNSGR